MLTRVEISKFRSCEDLVLDNLGPMTVLVGRNGAGKTNILRGIEWAARTATLNDPGALLDSAGSVEFDLRVGRRA